MTLLSTRLREERKWGKSGLGWRIHVSTPEGGRVPIGWTGYPLVVRRTLWDRQPMLEDPSTYYRGRGA